AQARQATPALDADALADYLRATVAPIVEAVARVRPDRVGEVTEVLYEFSLDLLGKDLFARYPALPVGWRILLGRLPEHLAAEPRRFAGSVTNALYNLSLTPGARPPEWIEAMFHLGGACADTTELLEAGKILAWRCGLAHYRRSALAACRSLPPHTARAA